MLVSLDHTGVLLIMLACLLACCWHVAGHAGMLLTMREYEASESEGKSKWKLSRELFKGLSVQSVSVEAREREKAYDRELMMPLVDVYVRVLLDHTGAAGPYWHVTDHVGVLLTMPVVLM